MQRAEQVSEGASVPAWVGVAGRLLAIALVVVMVFLFTLPMASGDPIRGGGRIVISSGGSVHAGAGGGRIERDEAATERIGLALGPRFARIESDAFVVFSDADRVWTDQRMRLLESTRDRVERAMERLGVPHHDPGRKLIVILFDRREDYRAFALAHDGVSADWVAGYYATRPNHIVFYHDRTRPDIAEAVEVIEGWQAEARDLRREAIRVRARESAERAEAMVAQARALETHATVERRKLEAFTEENSTAKAIHEAAHQLAFNCGLQSRRHVYPFWLTEGWATNFETDSPHMAFGPDHDHEPRMASWSDVVDGRRWMDMRSFVRLTDLTTTDGEVASDLYAQAYAVFRHLHRTQRAALGAYFQDIADEPAGEISADRLEALFERRFGDPERIERMVCR
ncbi:MAG: DUF1570 domain-containing protein [Phycisphaerales bacterium]